MDDDVADRREPNRYYAGRAEQLIGQIAGGTGGDADADLLRRLAILEDRLAAAEGRLADAERRLAQLERGGAGQP
jgi:hypothetical protein